MLQLEVQRACAGPVPEDNELERWITAALATAGRRGAAEVCVRLVESGEMSALNSRYRGRSGETNVLSFPAGLPEELGLPLLGDIVICAPAVRREAREQGRQERAHWAHLAVHGTLHLLGYDHIETADAEIMEALESSILAALDYPCPYRATPSPEYALR